MINWFGYFPQNDGYGRYNTRMVRALQGIGVQVRAIHMGDLDRPDWLLNQIGVEWDRLTISCCPPYMLRYIHGKHWLYSMTEGSLIPPSWVQCIAECNVERVIVPCEHNAKAFRDSGVTCPISVVPGGTDPTEFPVLKHGKETLEDFRPYTFLCFADRGERKGFPEVWDAFYLAFGGKTTGNQNVRLIVKGRLKDRSLLSIMAKAQGADERIIYQENDALNMYDVYSQADCLVLPSRSEGWGMPHREAACMGLPVITQQYSGLDDGHTKEWSLVVDKGEVQSIPADAATMLGKWRVVDKEALAQVMRYCYHSPETAAVEGKRAAQWIRNNQTWQHSALALRELIHEEERVSLERTTLPVDNQRVDTQIYQGSVRCHQ